MILARIQSLLPDLRPSERRVAEIVLARPTLTAGASIRMIAAAAEASEPTVMRFCRAVGCVGVQDLKRQIARDLGRFTPGRFAEASPAEPVAFLGQQTLDRAFETLFEMRKSLPVAGFAAASAQMAGNVRFFFWGPAAYGALLRDARDSCTRLGGAAEAACEPQAIAAQAGTASPGLCIVALDLPGPHAGASVPIAAVQCAKAAGAALIVLGSEPRTGGDGLAALADCCVVVPASPGSAVMAAAAPAADWLGPRLALHILLEGWKFEQMRANLAGLNDL